MFIQDKLKKVIREQGYKGLLIILINKILSNLFKIKIIKSNSIIENKIAKKIFGKSKLSYSDEGYWFLNPMPSKLELKSYYSSVYWDSRSGKTFGVNVRDLIHYEILNYYIPNEMSYKKTFLNFGAGHGGLSHLCWLKGMSVINVEPSLLPNLYNERWESFSSLSKVPSNSADIIYGSHSMEHVHNIELFKEEIHRIIKPCGYLFWEVPNADCPSDGAQNNRIDIPHTYYFQKKFFYNWLYEILLCEGFQSHRLSNNIQDWLNHKDSKGGVIRVLGRYDIKN